MNLGVVILLDALGVKGIWQRENPEIVIRKWEHLCKDALSAKELHTHISQSRLDDGRSAVGVEWRVSMFSDTIIFTGLFVDSKLPPPDDQAALVYDASTFLARMVGGGLRDNIRLRGALSLGQICRGENIIIGPAI